MTNTGATVVVGDLGVSPGTSVTGLMPGIVSGGTIHVHDGIAQQAQIDVTAAYTALDQPCTVDLTDQDLGGLTLTSGIYCFDSSAQLTGTLTLDGQNGTTPAFIFKLGSTLTTASNASVSVIRGVSPCNVFWQVGSSAIIGISTSFFGNILALASTAPATAAELDGRSLARTGAVTMDTNTVTASAYAAAPTPTFTPRASSTPTGTPGATSTPIALRSDPLFVAGDACTSCADILGISQEAGAL